MKVSQENPMKESIFKFPTSTHARFAAERLVREGLEASCPNSAFVKVRSRVDNVAADIILENRGSFVMGEDNIITSVLGRFKGSAVKPPSSSAAPKPISPPTLTRKTQVVPQKTAKVQSGMDRNPLIRYGVPYTLAVNFPYLKQKVAKMPAGSKIMYGKEDGDLDAIPANEVDSYKRDGWVVIESIVDLAPYLEEALSQSTDLNESTGSADPARWTGSKPGSGKYRILPDELKRKRRMQNATNTHVMVLDPVTGSTILSPFIVVDELPKKIKEEDSESEKNKKPEASSSAIQNAAVAMLKKVVEKDPKKFPKLAGMLGIKAAGKK
jgi:hypothetical protein